MIPGPDDAPAPGSAAAPAPTAVVTEQAAPADSRSSIERATDEARTRLAAGGSADPASVPAKKVTAKDEDSGRFTDQPKKRLPEPKTADETDSDPAHGSPEAGQEDEDEDRDEEGGKPPVEDTEAAEGQVEGEGEGEEDGSIVLDLPGRREGEVVKMKFAPEEAQEIRRLMNGYKRGEAVESERAELSTLRQELADWQEAVELDPGEAVARTLQRDPAALEQLALTILADPQMWARVAERVLGWDDPVQYELDASKLQIAANDRRDEVRELSQERRVVSHNLQQVQVSVAAVIPSDKLSEDQASTFYRDALRDLKEHAERHGLLTLDPRDIPLILASSGRFKAYGINPTEAAEKIQEALSGTRREGGAGRKPRTSGAPAPVNTPAPPPAKRGKDFAQGAARRRVAAAAPAGAGSPSTATTPPPGQTTEERVAWHRSTMTKGKTLTR